MSSKRPYVWAHRGASGYCPENTMAAFEKAIEMRADGIELDIQETKDGEIVICHDEKINRTSNGKGLIKDFTLTQLREFDFSKGKMQKGFEGAKIPTMKEVFELIKPTNLTINIELKTGVIFYKGLEEKIIKMTEEYGFMDRVIFSSFNHYSVKKIKELRPEAKCGFLYMDGTIDMPTYCKDHRIDALHPAFYNMQYDGFLENCAKNGIELNVWTINEEDRILRCIKSGVNAMITNYPDKVFGIIQKINGGADG